jgi:hypothetical protein
MNAWAKLIMETGLTKQKTSFGSYWILPDDYHPPRQQIPCLLKGYLENASATMDIKRRARDKDWTIGPPLKDCSHHPPYPQQVVFTQTTNKSKLP